MVEYNDWNGEKSDSPVVMTLKGKRWKHVDDASDFYKTKGRQRRRVEESSGQGLRFALYTAPCHQFHGPQQAPQKILNGELLPIALRERQANVSQPASGLPPPLPWLCWSQYSSSSSSLRSSPGLELRFSKNSLVNSYFLLA